MHEAGGEVVLGENWAIDIAVGLVAFIIAAVSLAAGVGGGGLFVPLLLAFYNFDTREATALSQAMLCGGALAAFFYNIVQVHPLNPARHLIDFELALLITPALLAGAQVGTIVHDCIPNVAIIVLLTATLLDSARKSVNCAVKSGQCERIIRNSLKMNGSQVELSSGPPQERPADRPADEERAARATPLTLAVAPEDPAKKFAVKGITGISNSSEEAELAAGSRTRRAQFKLVLVWVACLTVVFSKGYNLTLCEPQWWGVTVIAVVGLAAFALWFAWQMGNSEPLEGEAFDYVNLAGPLVIRSLFAGTLAAMCGIGGGMIIGPVLVELNVLPPVCAATTATTLLILTSSTAAIYMIRDEAPHDYAIYLCLFTVSGALFGKYASSWWVKRTGRQSVIFWCLSLITIASVVLMASIGVSRAIKHGSDAFQFRNFCSHH